MGLMDKLKDINEMRKQAKHMESFAGHGNR